MPKHYQNQPTVPQSRQGGALSAVQQGPFQNLINNPFLLNLLAQQGYSKMPGPGPLGVIAKAGLATQAQQQQQGMNDLRKRYMESMIGLNQAKALNPTGAPSTTLGKIHADIRSGRITPEQGAALIQAEVRKGTTTLQADTNKMRSEFRTDVSGPRLSLSGLAAAEQLLANNNAISDTAAFTSFIRAIDNSVVRPAEQEAYNKALGVRNQIEATVQQWAGKGPLPPQTKQALLDSIRSLRAIMEGIADRTVDFYNTEAEKFDLDPVSVTGIPVKFDQIDVQIDTNSDDANTREELEAELASVLAELDALRQQRAGAQ